MHSLHAFRARVHTLAVARHCCRYQLSHVLLRLLERCEPCLRQRTLRADTAAQSTIHQHVGGVCSTLSTGGPNSAILIRIGARRWRRCLGRWSAGTATQSTIHEHVGGVCLTLSTGGPNSAVAPLTRLRNIVMRANIFYLS